jgi:hypothetical protein
MGAAMHRGWAWFSPDGRYRYLLGRRWAPGPLMTFLLLNPSSADHRGDDPTLRRCIQFAGRERCGGLEVINVYAFRALNPRLLPQALDPVGPDNDDWIRATIGRNSDRPIVVGWGVGAEQDRASTVLRLLRGHSLHCLGMTRNGEPRHPLYLPGSTPLQPFENSRSRKLTVYLGGSASGGSSPATAPIAQSVERLHGKEKVCGSIPHGGSEAS